MNKQATYLAPTCVLRQRSAQSTVCSGKVGGACAECAQAVPEAHCAHAHATERLKHSVLGQSGAVPFQGHPSLTVTA